MEHAAADLSQWSCSWQLENMVTAEMVFQLLPDDAGVYMECTVHNHSDAPADAALHVLSQLSPEKPAVCQIKNALALYEPVLPPGRGLEFDTLEENR